MKKEYTTVIASTATSDDIIAAAAAGPVTVTRRMKRPRETTISDNATLSTTHSYDDNDEGEDDEGEDYCSGTIQKESQPLQQQEQQHEQEPHPYMSLYEPLLFATATKTKTETDEFHAYALSSSQSPLPLPQQQPEEISSSSFAIAEQPPQPSSPSPQINGATSIYRTKKRQKITTTTTIKSNASDNSIAEDGIQSVVDKEDIRMNEGTPNDDGHERITDSHIANNEKEEEDDDDTSFDSSDDEAIIERMKKLATKKKKKKKTGDDDGDDAIVDCSEYEAVIDDGRDSISARRMDNIVVDDDSFNLSDDEAVIDDGHDNISARRMDNDEDDNNDDSIWNLQQQANIIQVPWIEMYHRLVAYQKDHKDTKVPKGYGLDPQLGIWANNQRAVHRNKKMTEERKRLLNSIGFAWDDTTKQKKNITNKRYARWEEMYQRLVAYKKEHKDTNVPCRYKGDPQLGRWANKQRAAHRDKKMTEERKHLLNSIGFVWTESSTKNKASWEEMYQRLLAYKKEHKDTSVPQSYKKDPQLGNWVNTQRIAHRNKKYDGGTEASLEFHWLFVGVVNEK